MSTQETINGAGRGRDGMIEGPRCDYVALGEPLIVMLPDRAGPLRTVPTFERALGGAECNMLRGLTRLGGSCGLLSRVSTDEFGSFAVETLRAAGIDVSRTVYDQHRQTGLYFKEISVFGSDARPYYYRAGSASAALELADLDLSLIRHAALFITTGITALMSPTAHEAVVHGLKTAREAGVSTAFDPNLRPGLWGSDRRRELLLPLLENVDVYLGGELETVVLLGEHDSVQKLAAAVRDHGPREIVLKRGKQGAAALTDEGWFDQSPFRDNCAEPVGAGDAFNVGYLFLRRAGSSTAAALRAGAICASAVCGSRADFETFPRLEDLAAVMDEPDAVFLTAG
jgi:2-dehydro-3-deoxygluconokinase